MAEAVWFARLYVMRGMYLLNFLLLGLGVWYEFTHRPHPWDPITARRSASGPRSARCRHSASATR